MNERLNELYEELRQVRSSSLTYLPAYGYSPREEIISDIEDEIAILEDELRQPPYDCDEAGLEEERRAICLSQGLCCWC